MNVFKGFLIASALLSVFIAGCANDDGSKDYGAARQAIEEGRYEDAVSFLERACVKCPTNFAAFLDLSVTHLRLGNKVKAEGAITKALKINPESAEAVIVEGQIAYEKEDYTHAYANLDYVIEEKSLPNKVRSIAYVSRSVVKYVEKDFDGAKIDALMALSLNQRNAAAWNQIGIISRDSRYFEAANLQFAMAGRCLPVGDLRRERIENKVLGDLRKRLEIEASKGAKKVTFAEAKKLASLAKKAAAVDKALAAYRGAMNSEPFNQDIYVSAIKFAKQNGRWPAVVEFAQRSLLHEPGNKASAKQMKEALYKVGRRSEVAAWEEYISTL
ncbi:MAG: tetratricopeptide repeat protein [Kiritimatiellae bacterium]|nr:tetratricopeptide repeat protein [Kiritimatiellia bacterium]